MFNLKELIEPHGFAGNILLCMRTKTLSVSRTFFVEQNNADSTGYHYNPTYHNKKIN